jgi:hypothetical protein
MKYRTWTEHLAFYGGVSPFFDSQAEYESAMSAAVEADGLPEFSDADS